MTAVGEALVELERAHQLVDDLLAHPVLDGIGDAGGEVVAQENLLHALQAGLYRAELLHEVDAVGLVVDHAAHALQVSGGHFQSQRRFLLVLWLHTASLSRVIYLGYSTPPGVGSSEALDGGGNFVVPIVDRVEGSLPNGPVRLGSVFKVTTRGRWPRG